MPKKKLLKPSIVPEMEVPSEESEGTAPVDPKKDDIDSTISALNLLTDLLENPQNFLHTLLLPPTHGSHNIEDSSDEKHSNQIEILRSASKTLFAKLENLAFLMERVEGRQKGGDYEVGDDDGEDESPLSGLSELFTGEPNDSDTKGGIEDNSSMAIDVETIFGQVDIQNTALVSKVMKNIHKLSKRTGNTDADGDYQIRLLNMEEINSDDEGNGPQESEDSELDTSDGEEAEDSDGEDPDARRIRERMERTMAAMDDSDSSEANSKRNGDDDESIQSDSEEVEEDAVDVAREELNDGFFDLHEMEAFADEEEDMLPDEAYGEPTPENEQTMQDRKKNLPHLRGRKGNDEDADDQGFDDLERRVEPTVRRKKYREDDDINVLESLYNEVENEDEEDEDDVVNMSAADIFGEPRKPSELFVKNSKKENNKKSTAKDDDDSEADSWDDHDFESEAPDWRSKSNNKDNTEKASGDEEKDEDDIEIGEDNGGDEMDESVQTPAQDDKLSGFAERTKKMTALTEDLEKEALAEKPWQMLGETSSKKRPENSLLESTPQFEFATKMAPIITQEHTISIEEIIKQRILTEDWDDVIPRELPDIGLNKRNGELPEVSQEKSKLSLGELYEREYLKKATGYDKDAVEKETIEEKARNEMKMLFANICSKLDALSNYHFAPRPVAEEADVKTASTPAIAMEEVLPLHVSDARALAPEEIYGKKKGRDGILRGESEMNQADRKKLRQSKKAARRKARKAKLADEKLISRLKPELGLNNPYEKRKMREELQMARASGKVIRGEVDDNTDFKTSAKFFQRMQNEVKHSLEDEGDMSRKKRKHGGEKSNKSSKFKL